MSYLGYALVVYSAFIVLLGIACAILGAKGIIGKRPY